MKNLIFKHLRMTILLHRMKIQGFVRPLFVCLVVFLIVVNIHAQGTSPDLYWTTVQSDLGQFPNRLFHDSKAVFVNEGNIAALLGAGAVSVVMHNEDIDRRIADHFAEHDTFGDFGDEALNVIGSPFTHLPAAALWYSLSVVNEDDLNRQRALTMLSALAITDTVTLGLKAARHNDRPNGHGWAWPSGHTSSSFAVASVLHELYGLEVGIPAYIGAGLVAWRMMDVGDHWASDVLFGATLGCVVGHTVAGKDKDVELAGFEVSPYFGDGQTPALGVSFTRQF
jgi:hypothetical protein